MSEFKFKPGDRVVEFKWLFSSESGGGFYAGIVKFNWRGSKDYSVEYMDGNRLAAESDLMLLTDLPKDFPHLEDFDYFMQRIERDMSKKEKGDGVSS